MILSYNGNQCIVICNNDEEDLVEVHFYNMTTFDLEYKKSFSGTYVKMDLIE